MKTIFLNKLLPVMIFLLAVASAFATLSLQTAPETIVTGWVHRGDEPCMRSVTCSDIPNEFCRVSYPSGQIAELKIGTVCVGPLYRP